MPTINESQAKAIPNAWNKINSEEKAPNLEDFSGTKVKITGSLRIQLVNSGAELKLWVVSNGPVVG